MLKKIYLTIVLCSLSGLAVIAQNSGAIKGKVVDKTTGEPLPFASVVAEINGSQAGGAQTDFDGNFTIKPLSPGKYNLKATFVGYISIEVTDVLVAGDKITFQDLKPSKGSVDITAVEITEYSVPLIDKGNPATQKTITSEEVEAAPTRSVKSLAATAAGVAQKDEGDDINVRGSRDNSADYYIDGVKVRGNVNIPQSAIEQINIITGGTEAQYGDNTGGIINITTKGPSRNFGGGVEYATSEIFDKYGYNLAGANLSGPILLKKDANGVRNKPLLGFFISGEYQSEKDPDPSALGAYKVKDDKYNEITTNPLVPNSTGNGTNYATQYLHAEDLEKVDARPNTKLTGYRFTAKLDFQPFDKITFSFGGNYDNTKQNISNTLASRNRALFDTDHYQNSIETSWNAFARFTQRFGSSANKDKSASVLKNAYYSLQFDLSSFDRILQDAAHEDRFFDYGYIGKFVQTKDNKIFSETTQINIDSITGDTTYHTFWTQQPDSNFSYSYTPGGVNPLLENYTNQYYSLANNSVVSASEVQSGNGLINGWNGTILNTYAMWFNPGYISNAYQHNVNSQYRVTAMGSADIKNHNLIIGFEFEQRIERQYFNNPGNLWGLMRSLANQKYATDTTTVNDTTFNFSVYNAPPDNTNGFYENVRAKLGLSNTQYVDIDSYDRSNFSLDLFSADELVKNGLVSAYYGYDYTGKKETGTPTFKDYFTEKKDGNFTRRVDAFRPIYMAGYLQDRFAINDLIFNVGVRVDRFDANQKVLRDPYLLFPAKTAGELDIPDRPSNIKDSYIVYVNNVSNPSVSGIVGYRDGDTWYNAKGDLVLDPLIIANASGGKVAPYLQDISLANDGVKSENFDPDKSFKDYEPEINVMPRVAFQFPITDEAEFIAHYDVLTQRPQGRQQNDPSSYYFIEQATGTQINNPDLKPEKTTDYEIGFKQKVSSSSAISISAFYRELKNMIQLTAVKFAFPNNYLTYGNIDFGTVKGLIFSYDLRRTENIRVNAAYTLQFADGTGSADQTATKLLFNDAPNLRSITPFDFDQRHIFNISLDYRYGTGKDYNGPILFGKQFFANTGANFLFKVNSGTPYTIDNIAATQAANIALQQGATGQVKGSVNGARLPWQYRIDVRIDRDFELKFGKNADKKKTASINVYLLVQNLLNTKNIITVYRYSGSPVDDGYLASAQGQQDILTQADAQSYIDLYNIKEANPNNYSLPRRMRLGVLLNF